MCWESKFRQDGYIKLQNAKVSDGESFQNLGIYDSKEPT